MVSHFSDFCSQSDRYTGKDNRNSLLGPTVRVDRDHLIEVKTNTNFRALTTDRLREGDCFYTVVLNTGSTVYLAHNTQSIEGKKT